MTQSAGSRRRDHPQRGHGLESISVHYSVLPVHVKAENGAKLNASVRRRDENMEGKVERHLSYLLVLV